MLRLEWDAAEATQRPGSAALSGSTSATSSGGTAPTHAQKRAKRAISKVCQGGRARFERRKTDWLQWTPIDRDRPDLGSWLVESQRAPRSSASDSGWGLHCKVCEAAANSAARSTSTSSSSTAHCGDQRRPWSWTYPGGIHGGGVKWCNLERHSKATFHLAAVADFIAVQAQRRQSQPDTGTASPSQSSSTPLIATTLSAVQAASAPSVDEFERVLVGKSNGQSYRMVASQPGPDVSVVSRHRATRITWCLAEAAKQFEQHWLRTSRVVGLQQDASGGILIVKYMATNDRLERRSGILGLAKDYGTKANDTYKATMSVLKNFWTETLGVPWHSGRPRPLPAPVFQEVRHREFLDKIVLFSADAASDEQRVGSLLRGKVSTSRPAADSDSDVLKNVKVVMRDPTHAATRSP